VTTPGRYRFDGFEMDTATHRVTRGGQALPIPERHFEVLLELVVHAGSIISKDALVAAAWPDVAVTDNSLEQAISLLRRILSGASGASSNIQTVPRQGYRFTGTVTRHVARESDQQLDALLAPHRAWLQGRAALESLTLDDVASAMSAFERVLASEPEYAAAHVGAANALALRFQATRTDRGSHVGVLQSAIDHARTACQLERDSGEAWATLGFVLHSAGQLEEALAAARRAVMLEPDNWQHSLRLAFVGWGQERLRAAHRTLTLLPDLALAHWLAATVQVARQAFDAAEQDLDAGAAAQDAQRGGRFSAVGLHWLRGLVRLRRGDEDGARDAFARELEFEASGHIYARECCANVWYALAGIARHRGEEQQAAVALQETLRRIDRHPLANAAMGVWAGGDADVDAAHASAVHAVTAGDVSGGAARLLAALRAASPGSAGWTVAVDPWLRTWEQPSEWNAVLACVRNRAV
jgi:DNA-binding winged helix-turn-helix (wHTH) protein